MTSLTKRIRTDIIIKLEIVTLVPQVDENFISHLWQLSYEPILTSILQKIDNREIPRVYSLQIFNDQSRWSVSALTPSISQDGCRMCAFSTEFLEIYERPTLFLQSCKNQTDTLH